MDNTLTVEASAWQVIAESSKNSFPEECCGFLFGRTSAQQVTVITAMEVGNTALANKDSAFEINAQTYVDAENYAEQYQLSLIGIYHSHPNQIAVPSITDYNFALPDFFYIIVSVIEEEVNEVRAWLMDDEYECFNEQKLLST